MVRDSRTNGSVGSAVVAFIRRVRTASGATAVQIAEYGSGRRQRIVAHVGSAHTEAELGVLMARARAMLEDAAQGELDLGLASLERRHALVPAGRDPCRLPAGWDHRVVNN